MKPYPLTDKDSIDLLMMGSVKAGFSSPAEDVREKLDLVKLLVQHSPSTFFFRIDGISMVDADEKNTKYKPIPVGPEQRGQGVRSRRGPAGLAGQRRDQDEPGAPEPALYDPLE